MNSAHLHLTLVHLPVVLIPLAVLILILAIFRRELVLQKLSVGIFIFASLAAIPAFLTGEPSEEIVEDLPQVSENYIENHEEAAETAFYITLISGALALGVLLSCRYPKVQKTLKMSLLAAGITSSLSLFRAANLGGQIRHSEIRSENSVVSPSETDKDND